MRATKQTRTGSCRRCFSSWRRISSLKPAISFLKRAGFFVVEMRESSQVAEIAERFYCGMNARIEMTPVMNAEDLQKALSGVRATVQRYG
jgi:hypothetical protein